MVSWKCIRAPSLDCSVGNWAETWDLKDEQELIVVRRGSRLNKTCAEQSRSREGLCRSYQEGSCTCQRPDGRLMWLGAEYRLLRQGTPEEDQVMFREMLSWKCLWNIQIGISHRHTGLKSGWDWNWKYICIYFIEVVIAVCGGEINQRKGI